MSSSELPKLWTEPTKFGHIFRKDSTNFIHWKMTLKVRILRFLTRLFIILVSLMRSLFSEKMFISNRCISGLMSNLIRKSRTDSNLGVRITCYVRFKNYFGWQIDDHNWINDGHCWHNWQEHGEEECQTQILLATLGRIL